MKTYKVWIKTSVEEIDEDRGIYRDVIMDNGELVEDTDPHEESFFETEDYSKARAVAGLIMRRLCGENPG